MRDPVLMVRPRMYSADNIPIDKFNYYSHLCTVPNSEYSTKEKALTDLNRLGFKLHTKEIIIKGCKHHGFYYEIYIKTSIKGF